MPVTEIVSDRAQQRHELAVAVERFQFAEDSPSCQQGDFLSAASAALS